MACHRYRGGGVTAVPITTVVGGAAMYRMFWNGSSECQGTVAIMPCIIVPLSTVADTVCAGVWLNLIRRACIRELSLS